MAKRVFLHVGLPKSGTTFLQAMLAANKKQLRRQADLLYPGRSWKDQVRATRDVRQMPLRGKRQRIEVPGAWGRLVDEVNAWSGDAVVSMEWLCGANPEQIRRMVQDLEPARVEVVFTVRDLGRTIPASWQESIQNQNEWSWREFLQTISAEHPEGESGRSQQRFWKLHDTVGLIGRWTGVLPAEQVHVITVPKSGAPPNTLWDRFADVLGIDGSGYDAQGLANESLGLESTELLRLLNPKTRQSGISTEIHKSIITQQLGKRGLSGRKHREPKLTIPGDMHDWVQSRSAHEIDGIKAAGVEVVGDLEELRPDLSGPVGVQPEDLDPNALLETALDALVIAVQQRGITSKRQARQTKRLTQREKGARRRLEAWQAHPFRSALRVRARRSKAVRAVVGRLRGSQGDQAGKAGGKGTGKAGGPARDHG